jgi:hypothetical protein
MPTHPVEVRLSRAPGAVTATWRWDGGGLEARAGDGALADLQRRRQALLDGLAAGRRVADDLWDFGERLGAAFVTADGVGRLLEAVDLRHNRFSLCLLDGDPAALELPWEALVLPGTAAPLFYHERTRGWLDFARRYDAPADAAPRRAGRDARKCLAAWSLLPGEELLVEGEADELRRRLLDRPGVMFRWARDPDLAALTAALRRECALFLYTGHGSLDDDEYWVRLRSGPVGRAALAELLRAARAEVLVFDSCDSGVGHAGRGLPALLAQLPAATCLVGIQGPGLDTVSRYHVPALVERLLVGEPVWLAVNLLRLFLYEQRSDGWFLPAAHLRRDYRPADPAGARGDYLEALARRLEGRGAPAP